MHATAHAQRDDRPPPFRWLGPGCLEVAPGVRVWKESSARLPTELGRFEIFVFRTSLDEAEHAALRRGTPTPGTVVPVRIHSECLTGDVFSSVRCDCRAQLLHAQAALGRQPHGALLYLRQEGRGIGLSNKIRAYALQEQGLDTVEANHHLGFDDDLRRYDIAAGMLALLGIERVALYTNNPRKIAGLEAHGIEVVERRPIRVGIRPENARYLKTKKERSGHLL
ncbi:MAG: GTP cyclohydrolase II [Deltaproteobacteria bacterium]|nr:MAG: GTP cyclohydrolase II [Deltaproteobacteria bacterium]